MAVVGIVVGTGACERPDPEAALEAALERSRAVAEAEWIYGADTLPPSPGDRVPRIEARCRITLPGGSEAEEVACGQVFVGLDPEADSAWIARVVRSLGAEVLDRGRVPGWSSALGEPQPYLLLRVEPGTEARTLQRAFNSDGIRFVDVRPVRRRRP